MRLGDEMVGKYLANLSVKKGKYLRGQNYHTCVGQQFYYNKKCNKECM